MATTAPREMSQWLRQSKVFDHHPAALGSKHSSYLQKLSVGVRLGGVVENSLLDVRVTHAAAEATAIMAQGSVITTVLDAGEVADRADGKAWLMQGDEDLSTRAKFEERFKLRHGRRVNEVLHAFWIACVRGSGGTSEERMVRRAMASDSPGIFDVRIGFEEYNALYSRIFVTLLDDYNEEV